MFYEDINNFIPGVTWIPETHPSSDAYKKPSGASFDQSTHDQVFT